METFFERIQESAAVIEGTSFTVHKRPWGFSIALGTNVCINSITGEPSTHFHRYRTEEYVLFSGQLTVWRGPHLEGDLEQTIAELVPTVMKPGDKILIPPNTVHIPLHVGPEAAIFFDIYHGEYVEEDVQRVYDKGSRDKAIAQKWAELGYKPGLSIVELIQATKRKLKK